MKMSMPFINCLNLLNLCLEHDILVAHEGLIFVQHENGPALWEKELLAQELMQDEEGQEVLLKALADKKVTFHPFDFTMLDNAIAKFEHVN